MLHVAIDQETGADPPAGGSRCVASEIEYLDTTGDGVPDGVRITETWAVDRHGSGTFDGLERVIRVEHRVGIDGRPERVGVSHQPLG